MTKRLEENDDRWLTNRQTDVLFIVQVTLNIAAGVFIAVLVLLTLRQISEINQRQIQAVQQQNNTQLCAQHDIVIAVRQIGVKLGLPVDDIRIPDVEGLNCP